MNAGDTIKVAVRVRPMNTREKDLNSVCAIEMSSNQIILHHPSAAAVTQSNNASQKAPTNTTKSTRKSLHVPKFFAFDQCFWSYDAADEHYCNQDDVYRQVGRDILENAFQGYNACMFAYGQTGSGKSYTMMGGDDTNCGVIPRLCTELFTRIEESGAAGTVAYNVEVSYTEIYNEKVYDLLHPSGTRESLRVREHSALGTYVDGLSQIPVQSCAQIQKLMIEGNKTRTIAATNMNSESSRSHAVFSIVLTQTTASDVLESAEKVSKICLVDLAGSERAAKTGASGERLKEGGNINKSLTTLGVVISTLADISAGKAKTPHFCTVP